MAEKILRCAVYTRKSTEDDLAKQQGKCRKHLSRMVELSCLAPDIVTAIVSGQQPGGLSAKKLRSMDLPLSWSEQRRA